MARQTNKPVHYRQDVHLSVTVIVDGTEKQFNVLTDDLRDAIEEYVLTLLPGHLTKGLDQRWASRGPGGSRYFSPGEDIDRDGIHVQMSDLGVPTVEVD